MEESEEKKKKKGKRELEIMMLKEMEIVKIMEIIKEIQKNEKQKESDGFNIEKEIEQIEEMVIEGRYIINKMLRIIENKGEREVMIEEEMLVVMGQERIMKYEGI